ncbi:MAG: alcohol dehydrogenase catalytic domain-containing protein [Solirubrobacterales bacterium]
MSALRYAGEGAFEIFSTFPPEPGPGEVSISVRACGICGTDLQVLAHPQGHPARPGVILGHEFAGEVTAVGDGVDSSVVPGTRVVVAPDLGCGHCPECRLGQPMSCGEQVNLGINRDGGFADHATVPSACCYPLPDRLGWVEASLVEPLACVPEALGRVQWRTGPRSAAVVGGGPMGVLATAALAGAGVAPLVAFEPSKLRRALLERCGASATADGSEVAPDVYRALTHGDRAPSLVFNATGHLLAECIELAAPRGTVVQLGYARQATVVMEPRRLVEKGLVVIGSNGTEFASQAGLEKAAGGELPLSKMVTARIGLSEFGSMSDRMRAGLEGKVVVTGFE